MACGQFVPVSSEWHVETEAHSLVVGLSTVGGKGQAGTLACAQLKWMHSGDALFQQLNWQWLLQPASGLVDAPTTVNIAISLDDSLAADWSMQFLLVFPLIFVENRLVKIPNRFYATYLLFSCPCVESIERGRGCW